MTLYNKVKAFDKILKDAAKAEKKFRKERYKLERERTKTLITYALKVGLASTQWYGVFERNPLDGSVVVSLYTKSYGNDKLSRLAGDHMLATELTKGVCLLSKRDGVEVQFTDASKAKKFIAKYQLSVDFSNVAEEYKQTLAQKETMDDFLSTYGVTIEQITGQTTSPSN